MRADAANGLTFLARPCRIAFSVTDITSSDIRDAGSYNLADILVGIRWEPSSTRPDRENEKAPSVCGSEDKAEEFGSIRTDFEAEHGGNEFSRISATSGGVV